GHLLRGLHSCLRAFADAAIWLKKDGDKFAFAGSFDSTRISPTTGELNMPRRIADMVKYADEETKQGWASGKMCSLTDLHVIALDLAGWKITRKDEAEYTEEGGVCPKWPFDSERTGCPCPDWCEDLSPKPAATVLSFPEAATERETA